MNLEFLRSAVYSYLMILVKQGKLTHEEALINYRDYSNQLLDFELNVEKERAQKVAQGEL